jgi:hypothetical protein
LSELKTALLVVTLASKLVSQASGPSGLSPGQDDREKLRSLFLRAFSSIGSPGNDTPLLGGIDVTLGSTTADKAIATVSAKCNYDYIYDLGPQGAFQCKKNSSVKLDVEVGLTRRGSEWVFGNHLVLKESNFLGSVVDALTPSVTLQKPAGGHTQDREAVLKMLPSNFPGDRVGAPPTPKNIIAVVLGTYGSLVVVEASGQRHFVIVHPHGAATLDCGGGGFGGYATAGYGDQMIPLACPGVTEIFVPPDYNRAEVFNLNGASSAVVQSRGVQRVYKVRAGDQAMILAKQ